MQGSATVEMCALRIPLISLSLWQQLEKAFSNYVKFKVSLKWRGGGAKTSTFCGLERKRKSVLCRQFFADSL